MKNNNEHVYWTNTFEGEITEGSDGLPVLYRTRKEAAHHYSDIPNIRKLCDISQQKVIVRLIKK